MELVVSPPDPLPLLDPPLPELLPPLEVPSVSVSGAPLELEVVSALPVVSGGVVVTGEDVPASKESDSGLP